MTWNIYALRDSCKSFARKRTTRTQNAQVFCGFTQKTCTDYEKRKFAKSKGISWPGAIPKFSLQSDPGFKDLGSGCKSLELCADVSSDVGIKAKSAGVSGDIDPGIATSARYKQEDAAEEWG